MTDARNRTIHLVLPTEELGGAEKRLLGIFLRLLHAGQHDLRLLCRASLVRRATETVELGELGSVADRITIVPPGHGGAIDLPIARAIAAIRRRDPRSVFHFVLLPPPLALCFGTRTLFTIPAADIGLYNVRGRIGLYAGCATATFVDCLEERVMKQLVWRMPWTGSRFRVTPGSYVDLALFAPLPWSERTNTIVFLGTFLREKGAYRLADQLPEIDARLRRRGHVVTWHFMGRDAEEPPLSRVLASLRGPSITVGYERNPQRVLARARVFLSLQLRTNYPSKSLLEAMAAGCVPVVTDVGRTREVVEPTGGFFVSGAFEPSELAEACASALELREDEHERLVASNRALLARRFSVAAAVAYYDGLYRELAVG